MTKSIILGPVTSTSTGGWKASAGSKQSFQAYGTTTSSTGAATILIEVTNDTSVAAELLATITLTLGTTETSSLYSPPACHAKYVRARVSAISGTGASISVNTAVLEE